MDGGVGYQIIFCFLQAAYLSFLRNISAAIFTDAFHPVIKGDGIYVIA